MDFLNTIILGDALEVLKSLSNESVDFIITSPPYADQRKNSYGGIKSEEYIAWFLPISEQLFRVLKSDGSFILNIKEKVSKGQRNTDVIELILELKKQQWLWTEQYIWHKKNSYPGKWNNRFRDAWEHCLHFTKQKKFSMYQEAVMIPRGNWAKTRLKKLSTLDEKRCLSKTKSPFGKKISNWVNRDVVYPTNVLHFATECGNKNHSAAFPVSLPTWFIKLFTKQNDIILDPFMGSGTSAVAAKLLNRSYIGIEKMSQYVDFARNRILSVDI